MSERNTRRAFLAIAGSGTLLVACDKHEGQEDVGAVEDLMREHGVIRRVLVVYRVAAQRLRSQQPQPLAALQQAATLMRDFGEEYHEKQLEEAHLFPMLRKSGGPAVAELDTLLAQHQRGREITAYILAVAGKGNTPHPEQLAQSLEAFSIMYEEHAAREDTIVFPAWKKSLSAKQLAELGEQFEDIEHKTFGKDGFEDAVLKMAAIEQAFGINPAALTAPAPPPP